MKTVIYIRADDIFNDSRATKEIIALAEKDYQVFVLGWNRTGIAKEKCTDVFSQYPNVKFSFYSGIIDHSIGIRNITKFFGWITWAKHELKTMPRFSLIHACDLDSGIIAYSYCKKYAIPYIYDIYDYYIDSHNIPHFIKWMVEELEIKVIDNAELVVICTEERREQIKKSKPQKLIVVHNSPDVEMLHENEIINYDYAYCGELSSRRMLDRIFEDYPKNADISMCIAGNGWEEKEAIELDSKFDNLLFKGEVSYAEVINIEKHARCLSAIYDPSYRNHRLCAPNKFYEALALGKPVIVCRGTGIDNIVGQYKIGIVIDYDVSEFYQAIRRLKASPSECIEMGKRARQLYEDRYRWKIMRDRLYKAYQSVLSEK